MSRVFVLVSDAHCHAWSAFAKGDGAQNTRLRRTLDILETSLAKAEELGVPWVFGGDIVHTAGYTLNAVLGELVESLSLYPTVPKLAVWGNHDARGVGGKILFHQTVLATLHRAVPNFTVLDPTLTKLYKDEATSLTFSGAGYQPRADLVEYGVPADVGVYHQTVRGTKGPNGFVLEEGIPAEELLKRHKISVVGHVHHWQYARVPNPKWDGVVLVPGSPEHQNFGDLGEHGWWVITLPPAGSTAPPDAQMIAGGSPEFRTVATPADVKDDGHFYRVRNVPAGAELPEGTGIIGPTPTVVESRDALRGARGDQILEVWLKTEVPEVALPAERYLAVGRALLGSADVANLQSARLMELRLRNFCSYAEQAFTVRDGTWLIIGKGRDFPSNGAGKSTLFEALFWCLFGRTTKGLTGDEVIRWGTDDCEVTATFQLTDDWLRVTRSRGSTGGLEVETSAGVMEGKSVVENTQKLGAFLGITPELYQALGYFSQERLLLFASATDGERKEMLADLIGLSAYQSAASAAQEELTALTTSTERARTLRDAASAQVVSEQKRLTAIQSQSAEWLTDFHGRVQDARASLAQHEADTPQLIATRTRELHTEFTASISAHVASLEQAVLKARARIAVPPVVTNTAEELAAAHAAVAQTVAEVTQVRSALAAQQAMIKSAETRLATQRKSLAVGICPSCRQVISDEHKAECLAPTEAELAGLIAREEELAAQQAALLPVAVEAQRHLGNVQAGVNAAADYARAQQDLATTEAALAEAKLPLEDAERAAKRQAEEAVKQRREALEDFLARLLQEKNPLEREEVSTQERITAAQAKVSELQAACDKAQEESAVYDYWRRGFSRKGIQSLLVDEVAVLFNDARGTIFPALTQGVYDVQFSTLSQTKAGEWREKTEFQVFERGQLVPYSALSGGQRRRVDVGVMLTLVKAISAWMQVPGMLGVLVLDEVFGFLDNSGAEGLMEALREVQEQIPSIFVVSHEPQLQALFPEVIIIEQDQQGVSRIMSESVAS